MENSDIDQPLKHKNTLSSFLIPKSLQKAMIGDGYSSGDSGKDKTRTDYSKLTLSSDKNEHILNLWKKCWIKSYVASFIIRYFKKIHSRIIKYGTTTNLKYTHDEKIKYIVKRKSPYVLMQDNKFLMYWNIILIILLFYCAIILPYLICFIPPSKEMNIYDIVDLIVDVFFLFDIIINFISAYDDSETDLPVVGFKDIAKNYLTGFFFIDLLAVIPFQLMN